ncbi:phytosulfokine receptor 1-like [Papaver somniferum]|uniref:phytosulfokine receptor 1-like n=1 Tax=Papaver somniferum TaxID=3469 RepID=UPI000E701581|nr:phytosulfokine receptor 1-like [Papaver somniferum]
MGNGSYGQEQDTMSSSGGGFHVLHTSIHLTCLEQNEEIKVSYSVNETCSSDDFRALDEIAKGLESGITGWRKNYDCCSWVGVMCELFSSIGLEGSSVWETRVVVLDLGSRQLKGNFPVSVVHLKHLRYLNFSDNFLKGMLPAS